MDELERIELEAEQAGREDRVAELMAEVDMMNEIDRDHEEALRDVWLAAMTPEERAEHDTKLAAQRAELATWKAAQAEDDGVPF